MEVPAGEQVGEQFHVELVGEQLETGAMGQDAVDHLVEGGYVGDSGAVVGVGGQLGGEVLVERFVKQV